MSIATLIVEDNQFINDHLIIALHELTEVHVMAVAQTPVRSLPPKTELHGEAA